RIQHRKVGFHPADAEALAGEMLPFTGSEDVTAAVLEELLAFVPFVPVVAVDLLEDLRIGGFKKLILQGAEIRHPEENDIVVACACQSDFACYMFDGLCIRSVDWLHVDHYQSVFARHEGLLSKDRLRCPRNDFLIRLVSCSKCRQG